MAQRNPMMPRACEAGTRPRPAGLEVGSKGILESSVKLGLR
jgi:hypothetical protein